MGRTEGVCVSCRFFTWRRDSGEFAVQETQVAAHQSGCHAPMK